MRRPIGRKTNPASPRASSHDDAELGTNWGHLSEPVGPGLWLRGRICYPGRRFVDGGVHRCQLLDDEAVVAHHRLDGMRPPALELFGMFHEQSLDFARPRRSAEVVDECSGEPAISRHACLLVLDHLAIDPVPQCLRSERSSEEHGETHRRVPDAVRRRVVGRR